jgi:hypothetical protein
MRVLALSSIVAVAACAQTAEFRPTERVRAVSPSGQPAAAYEIRSDPDADSANISVFVWSEGAEVRRNRTRVELGMTIRNTSDVPVTMDPQALALEAFSTAARPFPQPQLERVFTQRGGYVIPPQTANTFYLRFQFPLALSPERLGSLRVRWALLQDSGERYVQFTEFRRRADYPATGYVAWDPWWGMYDPYFWGRPYYRTYVPVGRVHLQHRDRPRPRPQG